jgi:CTP:molybdopterin cytidylyltransferase MocA
MGCVTAKPDVRQKPVASSLRATRNVPRSQLLARCDMPLVQQDTKRIGAWLTRALDAVASFRLEVLQHPGRFNADAMKKHDNVLIVAHI